MNGQRSLRKPGETLLLNGSRYRLNCTLSECGGVVLYSAAKEGCGPWTDCLIRELFTEKPSLQQKTVGTRKAVAVQRDFFIRQQHLESELFAQLPGRYAAESFLCEAQGFLYSVRILPAAVSLQTLLEQTFGGMPLDEALPIADKLLVVLEQLHRKGFLHLSIDPSRIVFLAGDALMLDFEILWDKEQLLRWGPPCGNAAYTAPELRLKDLQQTGAAADLYSVCAVLFRLLMGRPLQESELLGQGLYRNLAEELSTRLSVPPSALAPFIQFFQKGLHTLPHRRWQSAAQLREAMHQAAAFVDAATDRDQTG